MQAPLSRRLRTRTRQPTGPVRATIRLLLAAFVLGAVAGTTLIAGAASPASADTTVSPGSITMGAYWSANAGFGSTPPSVIVTSDGGNRVVHLQGAAKQLSSPIGCDQIWCLVPPGYNNPSLLGVLPAGARPDRVVYTIAHTMDGTYADLSIDPQGDITMIGAKAPDITDYSFVSLEGVTFGLYSTGAYTRSQSVFPTNGWSASNSYGAAQPTWFETDTLINGADYADQVIHLVGALQQTAPAPDVTSLYIGSVSGPLIPAYDVHAVVHTLAGTFADLTIDTSGNVYLSGLDGPNFGFVSFEGVTYVRAGSGPDPSQALNLNYGWTAQPPGADHGASWYQDPSGVVHLEGVAAQPPGVESSDLVGILPPAVSPTRYVFAIAATSDGTYSDLAIDTHGKIWLIGARAPALTNFSTVSLDDISFDPNASP